MAKMSKRKSDEITPNGVPSEEGDQAKAETLIGIMEQVVKEYYSKGASEKFHGLVKQFKQMADPEQVPAMLKAASKSRIPAPPGKF